jgi:pimeloyl-ACP methyl ester carboxylesterase
MADDVIAILDYYGIEKAHMCGPSMGGVIAQIIATKYPHRCFSIIPIMTAASPNKAMSLSYVKNQEWFELLMKQAKPVTKGMSFE